MFDEFGFPGDAHSGYAGPVLETFVYCSRAAEGVDDAEVDRIIELSQRRNVARDITGVLVFGSGVFFQWIEGPPAQVESLIASLHGDPRHHDIVTLDRSVEKRARLYPDWEMERVGAEDIRAVPTPRGSRIWSHKMVARVLACGDARHDTGPHGHQEDSSGQGPPGDVPLRRGEGVSRAAGFLGQRRNLRLRHRCPPRGG